MHYKPLPNKKNYVTKKKEERLLLLSLQIATMQISHNSQEALQEKPPPYPHPLEAFYQDVQEQFSILHGLRSCVSNFQTDLVFLIFKP